MGRGVSCREKMGSQPMAVPQHSPNWHLMKSLYQHELVGLQPQTILSSSAIDHCPIASSYYLLLANLWQFGQIWSTEMNGAPPLGWDPGKTLAGP